MTGAMTVVHSRPRSRITRSRSAAGMRIIGMCHPIYCRKAKATQVRSTRDAALGDGTIQFVLERSWRLSRARSGACGPAEGYGRVDDVAVRVGIHLVTQRSSQCGMMRNLSYPLTLMSSAAPEQLLSLSSFVQACFQVQLDQGCFTRSNFVFLNLGLRGQTC